MMNSWCNLDAKPKRLQAKKRRKWKIEFRRNLPIPPPPKRGRPTTFPFEKLKIGQCFIVKNIQRNVLAVFTTHAEQRLNRKFVMKKLADDSVGVWRRE